MMKEKTKKMVANAVVNLAVQTAKMPNQVCFIFAGKAKSKLDLTSNDYEEMASFMKCK